MTENFRQKINKTSSFCEVVFISSLKHLAAMILSHDFKQCFELNKPLKSFSLEWCLIARHDIIETEFRNIKVAETMEEKETHSRIMLQY